MRDGFSLDSEGVGVQDACRVDPKGIYSVKSGMDVHTLEQLTHPHGELGWQARALKGIIPDQ